MKDKYETFEMVGFICYGISVFTAVILVVELATMIPWIVSPYGAFVHLLMPNKKFLRFAIYYYIIYIDQEGKEIT